MSLQLEHANLIVRDIDGMLQFLNTAFPEFEIRGEGMSNGRRWLHVGTENTYLALNESSNEPAERWRPYTGKPGLNHLGYEVDDADALRARMAAAGYEDSTVPNDHRYRKRVYFYDPEGNDWEFVQYFSEDPEKRNEY